MKWIPWAGPGLERLALSQQQEKIIADSVVHGVEEEYPPFRITYSIQCDMEWRLRTVSARLLTSSAQHIDLLTDGEGNWSTKDGEDIPAFKGCLYVDITATPFTNTLPIKRLKLQAGTSATIKVVYIIVPQMSIEVVEQRYTCLEKTASRVLYRFESLENGESVFTADLPVDQDGLVLDYPGLFRRT